MAQDIAPDSLEATGEGGVRLSATNTQRQAIPIAAPEFAPAAPVREEARAPLAPVPSQPPRRRLWAAGLLMLLLLLCLLLPPLININRYGRQVAATISASLGRQVEVGGVHLKLLPRPGFQISRFVVDETSGFGAEPMLQCSNVTASLRLLSLWRGRFEVSRISFEDPSLNLVRDRGGYWNFASVLTQASRAPNAPTSQVRPSRNLRFPYIEATNARINFKYGDEKKPFSFLNADVAVWLESPSEWRLRFTAQPVRTDMNFSANDTGVVRVSGTVRRAAALGALPLDLEAEWQRAPLGQLSRMFTGEDFGWRADTDMRAQIRGTADHLLLKTRLRTSDFHRAEFAPRRAMPLAADCDAEFLMPEQLVRGLRCVAPVGSGSLMLSGEVARVETDAQPQLALDVEHAPAGAMLELLRHLRSGFSQDVSASGTVTGRFTFSRGRTGTHTLSGAATVQHLALRAPGLRSRFDVPEFRVTAAGPAWPAPVRPRRGSRSKKQQQPAAAPEEMALLLQPVRIEMSGEKPLVIDGRFTLRSFRTHVAGNAALARLLPVARALALLPASTQAILPEGKAELDLTLAEPWLAPVVEAGSAPSTLAATGTVRLQNARIQTSYLRQPLVIATAQGAIAADQIAWNDLRGRYGPVEFTGSFRLPLGCTAAAPCVRRFDLNAAELDVRGLRTALAGEPSNPLVAQVLDRMEPQGASWPAMEGTLRIGKLTAGTLHAQNMTVALEVGAVAGAGSAEAGREQTIGIQSLDGQMLSGSLHGQGSVAWGPRPRYAAEVQLSHADVKALAALFGESWGAGGTLNLAAKLKLDGEGAKDLAESAAGTMQWSWSDGGWTQLGETPLAQFANWSGTGKIADGVLTMHDASLTSGSETHAISGTITAGRQLRLDLGGASKSTAYGTVTGTFSEPEFTGAAAGQESAAAQP